MMKIEEALRIAGLWRAGKMIGADEDDVRDALLDEIERLQVIERFATIFVKHCNDERWQCAESSKFTDLQLALFDQTALTERLNPSG